MSVQLERQVRRMPSTKGYRSYRGRAPRGKIALAVVLVLVIQKISELFDLIKSLFSL